MQTLFGRFRVARSLPSVAPARPDHGSFAITFLAQALVLGLANALTSAVTAEPLPGASFRSLGEAHPTAISGDRTTVVGERRTFDGSLAFRWTATEGFVDLAGPPGGTFRTASAVSADGSVIVGTGSAPSGSRLLLRWTSAGGAAALGEGPLPWDFPWGVSADGSVVVGSMPGGSVVVHNPSEGGTKAPPMGFRWTEQTGPTPLGVVGTWEDQWASVSSSEARGISADGSVIVGLSTSEASRTTAFRWTAAGGMVGLGPGVATATSADGSVIIGHQGPHAFRWTEGGGMVRLEPQFPGDIIHSSASAVSGDGSVVVGSVELLEGVRRAFIWDGSRGMRLLEEVLTDEYGLDLGNLRLMAASGISADGRVITGYTMAADASSVGWVAVVPEPAGLALLALAAVLLRRGRGRSRDSAPAATQCAARGAPALAGAPSDNPTNARYNFFVLRITPVLLCTVLTSGAAAEPTFRSLDFVPADVSADGSVVVGTSGDDQVGFMPVVWTSATGIRTLGELPGWSLTQASSISADGSVVVGAGGNLHQDMIHPLRGEIEPFRWTSATGLVGLGRTGFINDYFVDVSGDGSVITSVASRWTADGGMVPLHGVSIASAVSDGGTTVVGELWGGSAKAPNREAVRWTAGEGVTHIGTLPGHSLSHASDVSADGAVVVGVSVGWAEDASEHREARLFRWTAAGGMADLGRIADGSWSDQGVATSADAAIVVGNWSWHRVGVEPFIFEDAHGMRPLRDVLGERGVDLGGWNLGEVRGISGDGRTFIGYGLDPAGNYSGWIAAVPEPGGLALLAVAGAALLTRRRPRHRPRYSGYGAVALVVCATPALAVVSSSGGADPPYTGLDINRHVGADRFYANGYTGSRAVVTNIEAGHVWNGHESLRHVSTFVTTPSLPAPHGDFDRHATWVGGVIGARPGGARPGEWQRGIAYGADLWSGAVAAEWVGEPYTGSFRLTPETLRHAYHAAMIGGVNGRTTDVVNSSWGSNATRDNRDPRARTIDAMVNQSAKTVVFATGNEGSATDPRPGSLASAFNTIAVGALTHEFLPPYGNRADFSSIGPNDFWNPATQAVVPRAVASLDLMAPGTDLTVAHYGGATGGNRGGPVEQGSNLYSPNRGGTTYAAPIVAGGAALVVDAGRALFPGNPHATDGRVVKSVLQNSATKIPGWNNGQLNRDGVVTTTRSLDFHVGAGALNLNQAFTQYTAGTADLPGLGGGAVQAVGWDFGEVAAGEPSDYFFSSPLQRGTRLTATLNWFLDNSYDYVTDTLVDQSLDNLDLEVWRVTPGEDVPDVLLAQSISTYNNVEHLAFQLTETSDYMLRVRWAGEVFDTVNDPDRELFALSWAGTPVPEPSGVAALLALGLATLSRGRERRRPVSNP